MLAEKIRRQNVDLAQSRMSVVCRLGMAAEFRDEDTGNHVIRVGCYSRAVAAAMGMPRSFLEMLLLAAPLHDIGKIGIPDSVLLKPGPLSDDEWSIMQRHCEMGHRILREQSKAVVPLFDWYAVEPHSMQDAVENRDPVLDMAASVALTHHEKWDGGGYPQGLSGEAIPLESRIVAIADVFDALTSNRPYRTARPEEEALTIIEATVGSHFDPRVYAAFLRSLPEIRAIRARFDDDVVVFPQAGRSDGLSERVLYMEDDAAQARLVQKCLERAGYTVDVAADGAIGPGPARGPVLRRGDRRSDHAGPQRLGSDPGHARPRAAAADHHGHRHRQRTNRRRGHEARRERLSRQGPRRRLRQRAAAGRSAELSISGERCWRSSGWSRSWPRPRR